MNKSRKVLVTLISVIMLCCGMTVFAKEPEKIVVNESEASVDIDRQIFTSVEDSILIPALEGGQKQMRMDTNATVVGNGVRLRQNPSTSAPVLELMYNGERVWYNADGGSVVEADGHFWYEVTREKTGRFGYVDWDYIQPDFER